MDLASGHLLPEFGELWPTFLGEAKIFGSGYLAHYLSERDLEMLGVWQVDTYSLHFVNFDLAVS